MTTIRYRPPRTSNIALLLPSNDEDLELLTTLEDEELIAAYARALSRAHFLKNTPMLEYLRRTLRLRCAKKGQLTEKMIRMGTHSEAERRPVEDTREREVGG